jgi:hypothetical protein
VLVVVKIFLVKVLASCFHVDKYFERIRDSLFNQFVLETLMGPPVEEERQSFVDDERLKTEVAGLKKAGAVALGLNMDQLTDSFLSTKKPIQKDRPQDVPKSSGLIGKSGLIIGVSKHSSSNIEAVGNVTSSGVDEKGISMQNLAKLNRRNVSAWNMKRLINLVKHTGVATLTHNIEDNLMEADANVGDQSNREINSEWQAKVAAKQIFKNVARPGRKYDTPHLKNPNPSIFVFPADYFDSNFSWGENFGIFCFFFLANKIKKWKQTLSLQFLNCLGKRSIFCFFS